VQNLRQTVHLYLMAYQNLSGENFSPLRSDG
jgi:hypothetical protein